MNLIIMGRNVGSCDATYRITNRNAITVLCFEPNWSKTFPTDKGNYVFDYDLGEIYKVIDDPKLGTKKVFGLDMIDVLSDLPREV